MSTSQAESQPFVERARARKASAIATYLVVNEIDPAEAAHLDDPQRRAIEVAVDIKPSSDQTWRYAIEMLAGSMSSAPTLCRTCGLGDPDGEPGPRKPWNHDGPCAQ